MAESPVGGDGVCFREMMPQLPDGSTPRHRQSPKSNSPAGDLQLPSIGGTPIQKDPSVEEMLTAFNASVQDSDIDEVFTPAQQADKLPLGQFDSCEQEIADGCSGAFKRVLSGDSSTSKISTNDGHSPHRRRSKENSSVEQHEFQSGLPEEKVPAQDPASGSLLQSMKQEPGGSRRSSKKLVQGRRSMRGASTTREDSSSMQSNAQEKEGQDPRSASKPGKVGWSLHTKKATNIVGASFFPEPPPATPMVRRESRRSSRQIEAPSLQAKSTLESQPPPTQAEQPSTQEQNPGSPSTTLLSALSSIAQPRQVARNPAAVSVQALKSEIKPPGQNAEEVCMPTMPATMPAFAGAPAFTGADPSPGGKNRLPKKKQELESQAANPVLDRVPSARNSQRGLGIVGLGIAKDGPGGKELADMMCMTPSNGSRSSWPAAALTGPQGNVTDALSVNQVQAATFPSPRTSLQGPDLMHGRRMSFPEGRTMEEKKQNTPRLALAGNRCLTK